MPIPPGSTARTHRLVDPAVVSDGDGERHPRVLVHPAPAAKPAPAWLRGRESSIQQGHQFFLEVHATTVAVYLYQGGTAPTHRAGMHAHMRFTILLPTVWGVDLPFTSSARNLELLTLLLYLSPVEARFNSRTCAPCVTSVDWVCGERPPTWRFDLESRFNRGDTP